HEALDKEKKHEEVAKLMKEANKLGEEHKYKEAYAKLQMAQTLDPDDASVNGAAQMAKQAMRVLENKKNEELQEATGYHLLHEMRNRGTNGVSEKELLKYSDDPATQKRIRDRMRTMGTGSIGVLRSRSEAEKSIERKLSTPISVNFKATALD